MYKVLDGTYYGGGSSGGGTVTYDTLNSALQGTCTVGTFSFNTSLNGSDITINPGRSLTLGNTTLPMTLNGTPLSTNGLKITSTPTSNVISCVADSFDIALKNGTGLFTLPNFRFAVTDGFGLKSSIRYNGSMTVFGDTVILPGIIGNYISSTSNTISIIGPTLITGGTVNLPGFVSSSTGSSNTISIIGDTVLRGGTVNSPGIVSAVAGSSNTISITGDTVLRGGTINSPGIVSSSTGSSNTISITGDTVLQGGTVNLPGFVSSSTGSSNTISLIGTVVANRGIFNLPGILAIPVGSSNTVSIFGDSLSMNSSNIRGAFDVSVSNALTVGNGLYSIGKIIGASLSTSGTITGSSLSAGTGTITGGAITGSSLSAGTGSITGGAITGSSLSAGTGSITGGSLSTGSINCGQINGRYNTLTINIPAGTLPITTNVFVPSSINYLSTPNPILRTEYRTYSGPTLPYFYANVYYGSTRLCEITPGAFITNEYTYFASRILNTSIPVNTKISLSLSLDPGLAPGVTCSLTSPATFILFYY